MQHSFPPTPRLLPELRLALSALYNNNNRHHQQQHQQCHDFLVQFQSRNVRRKIQSLLQQQADLQKSKKGNNNNNNNNNSNNNNDNNDNNNPTQQQTMSSIVTIEMGSSWLACLAAILQNDSNPTERIFAAQTLLHRLRRTKMVESIDIELEHAQDLNVNANMISSVASLFQFDIAQLSTAYQNWIQSVNPFVASVVQAANIQINSSQTQQQQEELLKVKQALVTLSSCAFLISHDLTTRHPQTSNASFRTDPLLLTLSSALVTVALRLRFLQEQHSIVDLIHSSFQVVSQQSSSLSSTPTSTLPTSTALQTALYVALSVIPDTILGSSGGARGRLSMDPKHVRQASQELQTVDMKRLWDTLMLLPENDNIWILITCEQWAKFLCLPTEIIQYVLPIVNKFLSSSPSQQQQQQQQQLALAYLIAIFDGASWNVQQVLSCTLGLTEQNQFQPANKKRQSNKSKKRHQEILQNNSTESLLKQAEAQVLQRCQNACETAHGTWQLLSAIAKNELSILTTNNNDNNNNDNVLVGGGEGPIGCIVSCANSCLPFLIRQSIHATTDDNDNQAQHIISIFQPISDLMKLVCASPNQNVRGMAFESLYSLHTALIETMTSQQSKLQNDALEKIVLDHFVECLIALASRCEYPPTYFDDIAASSDDELEVHRNDVRDVIRAICSADDVGCLQTTNQMVWRILQYCCISQQQQQQIYPETAIHAFSSLVKPVNHLSNQCVNHGGAGVFERQIFVTCLQFAETVARNLLQGFQAGLDMKTLIPPCRIFLIAIASFAPTLSSLLSNVLKDDEISNLVYRVLDLVTECSIVSLERIPELIAPSSLGVDQYDIRGTMRGPGGEDHVGCISLSRYTSETELLTRAMVQIIERFIERLCHLHKELKMIERNRGFGVVHGSGVTPQSRRMLTGVLCRLDALTESHSEVSKSLRSLFESAIQDVIMLKGQTINLQSLIWMTEAAFDLSSFSPHIVAMIFDNEELAVAVEVFMNACLQGYSVQPEADAVTDEMIQWNRLRAALFSLIRTSSNPDITPRAGQALVALITAECESIERQCRVGVQSLHPSLSLFHDDLISPDSVPSGVYIRLAAEIIEANPDQLLPNITSVLIETSTLVLSTVTFSFPDISQGSVVDPRPTLWEAWQQAMIALIKCKPSHNNPAIEKLLVDTLCVLVTLIFFPKIGKTKQNRASDAGMCLDGPHSLVSTVYLIEFFRLGPHALQSASINIATMVPVEPITITLPTGYTTASQPPPIIINNGTLIICAALYRATQGALPPWAVEAVPDIYSALFDPALQKDPITMAIILKHSMEIRLSQSSTSSPFGGIKPGYLLSGPFFYKLSDRHKIDFFQQVVELTQKPSIVNWRKLKTIIKALCGGKKKESDFKQKPSLTRWDFLRI